MLYEFSWSEFCDWYLEIVKPRLTEGGESVARKVLAHVVDTTLRLLHPFMPFFTEEVWQHLRRRAAEGDLDWEGVAYGESIMVSEWPKAETACRNAEAEATMGLLQDIIRALRNIRSKMDIAERRPLAAVIAAPDREVAGRLREHESILRHIGVLEKVTVGVGLEKPRQAATDVVGGVQVFVPLGGVVDLGAEGDRLKKRIAEVERGLGMVAQKLSNEGFVSRAPAAVVERERERRKDFESQIAKLRQGLAELEA